jgi:hypothetical protein
MPIDDQLRRELLSMREADLRLRDEIVEGSSSFAGYHPQMEELHRRNATRLKEIIAEHGWPGRSLVGEDGAMAAWFIAQHSIADPPFMRQVLGLLRDALAKGEVSPAQPAYLEDRICCFEGRPQVYGTQFEPGEDGLPQPYVIADPEHVNERRRAIGLNTIEERTRELRAGCEPEHDPQARAEYERGYLEWLKKVGWRT